MRELESIQHLVADSTLKPALISPGVWDGNELDCCDDEDIDRRFSSTLEFLGRTTSAELLNRGMPWVACRSEMVVAAGMGDSSRMTKARTTILNGSHAPSVSCCKVPEGSSNRDPAKMACIADGELCIQMLLEWGLDVDDTALGATLVQLCLQFDSECALRLLLRHGADPLGACVPADEATAESAPCATVRHVLRRSIALRGDNVALARHGRPR